jgi:hypothetical protein
VRWNEQAGAPTFRMFVGFVLSLVLPPTYTGRAYLVQALRQHGLKMEDDLINEIVAKCIPDSKKRSKLARLAGTSDLANRRANLVRQLNSVVLAIVSSRNGRPFDIYFHPSPVNKILGRGLVVPPKKLKTRLATIICCDNGHTNGFFKQELEEGQDITRAAMDLIPEPCSDDALSYCCCLCDAPVPIRTKNRDKWVVRTESDWIR